MPTTSWPRGDSSTAPALGKPGISLNDVAHEAGLSVKYLATIHATLTESWPAKGPLGELQALWRKMPADPAKPEEARRHCQEMRDLVVRARKGFDARVAPLRVKGISPGSQPLVLARNRQLAAMHMRYPGDKPTRDLEVFCRVFPDAFFVDDRGPYFDAKEAGKGRPLTAGFHLMQGYFRDDGPLCELVLDEAEKRELDALWWELYFITGVPIRQYKDFIFFERAEPPRFMRPSEFDFARSEDKDATSASKIQHLRDAYLARAKKNAASAAGDRSHRDILRRDGRLDSQSRAGSHVRRTEPSERARVIRRASLSPAAVAVGTRGDDRLLPNAAPERRARSRRRDPRHGHEHPDVAPLLLPARAGRGGRGPPAGV